MIAAIISIYMPGESAISNVKEIARQVDYVYICDNSPCENPEFAKIGVNVRYIKNNKNLGLPEAFNKILKDESNEWDKNDFVIFFDQDSQIGKNHVKSLINEYHDIRKNGIRIGVLGPQIIESRESNKVIEQYKNRYIITSSMLVKYDTLREVDFWNDEFFLDLADWDLCFRINKAGYVCIMSLYTSMLHTFGNGIVKKFGIKVRVGNPIREYYEARDAMRLLFKKYTPFKYRIRLLMQVTVRPLVHLLVLPNKKQRAAFFIEGIGDYLKGKTGEYHKL